MMWLTTFGLCLALAQAPPSTPADPSAEAMKQLDAGHPEVAVQLLRPVVEKEPDNVQARFNLALALSLSGDRPAAIEQYKKILAQQPEIYEVQLNLGQLLIDEKRYEEAIPVLERAAAKKEKESKPVYYWARALAGKEQWKEAAAQMARAVQLGPDDAMKLELADLYERAGMKSEALDVYRSLPNNPTAQQRQSAIAIASGDAPTAIAALEAELKTKPSVDAALALATAYLDAKQTEKSQAAALEAVRLDPKNVNARLFLGRLLRDQKRYPEAAQQFYEATKIQSDSLPAWKEFSAMLVVMNQHEGAVKALDRVRALGGETPAYFYLRAISLDALKVYPEALESYEKFLAGSTGQNPDEEFKARQRVRIIKKTLHK